MGLLDDVQSTINRGVAATGRTARMAKLRSQMGEAMKRRQNLAAQLGASLYEETKDNPDFRKGREGLYGDIASIDAERDALQAEIDELERQAAEEAQAAQSLNCPFCGTRMAAADRFCSGCGKPMEEVQSALAAAARPAAPVAADGPTCPQCGSPVAVGDAFCMHCGTKLDA